MLFIRIAAAGLRPNLQRIHLEKSLSIPGSGAQHYIIESPFHNIAVTAVHVHLQHAMGKENQPDRSARFRIRRIVWQVVIKGEGLSVMSRPDSSRNIQLFGSDIVP